MSVSLQNELFCVDVDSKYTNIRYFDRVRFQIDYLIRKAGKLVDYL